MIDIRKRPRTEQSLLLFLEDAAVNHGGLYDPQRVNDEDREIMARWRDEGFIDCGRVASAHIRRGMSVWVRLTPQAQVAAGKLRQERADRLWADRSWVTTAELNAPVIAASGRVEMVRCARPSCRHVQLSYELVEQPQSNGTIALVCCHCRGPFYNVLNITGRTRTQTEAKAAPEGVDPLDIVPSPRLGSASSHAIWMAQRRHKKWLRRVSENAESAKAP